MQVTAISKLDIRNGDEGGAKLMTKDQMQISRVGTGCDSNLG